MKKIICAMLACLMLAPTILVGCGSDDKPADTPAATTEAPAPEEPDPRDAKYDSITIGDVPLSEYTIVYADDEFASIKTSYRNSFTAGQTHYAKLIAEELAADLENMTGVKLTVTSTDTAEVEHEILVGDTSREQSATAMKGMTDWMYNLRVIDGKLCIVGGASAANYHALDELYKIFASQNSSAVALPADLSQNGQADVITVSCVGDSITEGYGSTNWAYCSWPAILQRILWKDYVILNYGKSGAAVRDDLNDAYTKIGPYKTMIRNASKADITLIMLGTNDSDRDQRWNDESSAKFNESYKNLVASISDKNSDMKYIMMNCPAYFGTGKFGSEKIRELQDDLFVSLKEDGYNFQFFNMYKFTLEDMTEKKFPDTLHPDDKGYVTMAKRIGEMLEAYRYDTEDPLLSK